MTLTPTANGAVAVEVELLEGRPLREESTLLYVLSHTTPIQNSV
jgi:hypothetical protein